MKRLLCLCLLLIFCGCAAPADPLAYQDGGARLSLCGQIDALDFSAVLTLEPVSEGGAVDDRGFTLAYTAPDSLCGITLARSGGVTTLTRGAITVPAADDRFAGMTLPAELFCIDCELGSAAVIEQNGTTLNRVTAADDEGSYTLWLDETGFPRRIEASLGGRAVAADILAAPADQP